MKLSIKRMVLVAMLSAIAYIMVFFIRIPIFPAASFLNYEPKDVIIAIGAFMLGPLYGFVCSLIVSLVEMVTISITGPIGCIMNVLSTCSFCCTAGLIYKKKHTLSGAVIGLAAGSVFMIAAMLLWNWLITPLYMGFPRQTIEGMLLPVFLPFNALKAGLNAVLTFLLYKPLKETLFRKLI